MGKKSKKKSPKTEHDLGAAVQTIEQYSDGDIDNRQEILEELHEGTSNNHKRLKKRFMRRNWLVCSQSWSRCSTG
tara:strand:+ start:3074 stop:3298 length:225 start_codon:yes stop_codon:yes gene_type:complete